MWAKKILCVFNGSVETYTRHYGKKKKIQRQQAVKRGKPQCYNLKLTPDILELMM